MKKFLSVLFAILAASAISTVAAQKRPQPTAQVPTPEYFGLYLLINGKLCGLQVQTSPCALKTVDVLIGRPAQITEVQDGKPLSTTTSIKAIELKSGVRFLSYGEYPTDEIEELTLLPMLYVRNIYIDTGWPNSVKRNGTENAWVSGRSQAEAGISQNKVNPLSQEISLLVKPLKENMVLGVPSGELTPGLYRLSTGQSFAEKILGYFWVGTTAEAESLKCVDAKHLYLMTLRSDEFSPCGN